MALTMKYQINPRPGFMYLEQAHPDAQKAVRPSQTNPQGMPGDPKGIILEVVRIGEGVTEFKVGDRMLIMDSPTVNNTPRGAVCKPSDVCSVLTETEGTDEMAVRPVSRMVAVSGAAAKDLIKSSQQRLD